MTEQKRANEKLAVGMRRSGQALGMLIAAIGMIIGVSSALAGRTPWTWESAVLSLFLLMIVVSAAVSWRHEAIGGILFLLCGLAFATFIFLVAGHNRAITMLIISGPMLLCGLLLLAGSRMRTS